MDLQTWPDMRTLNIAALLAPSYMFGSTVPYAVWKRAISDEACMQISSWMENFEVYHHKGCNASQTRELAYSDYNHPLANIDRLSRKVNEDYFKYDLAAESRVWHQTYSHEGSDYQTHMDGAPGVTRKLTAIVMLSDYDEYDGGELICSVPGDGGDVLCHPPVARGTVIWIQPWLYHKVMPVTRGKRESINMGFFGPPFR